MLSIIILLVAIIVTATAAFQWAGRLNMFGYQAMELAARHSFARNGNTVLAIVLWLIWFYT